MNWIWGGGGGTMFDVYSFHHAAWLATLTLINIALFKKHWWIGIVVIVLGWEFFEGWAASQFKYFPFVGKEKFINKVVGDTISDAVGIIITILSLRRIENGKKNTSLETKG